MPSGVYPRTKEHLQLLALARVKARSSGARDKIRQAHLGSKHPHRPETIEKIRQSRLGQAVVWGEKCLRCGYEWASKNARPLRCASCKTPYWDKERRK